MTTVIEHLTERGYRDLEGGSHGNFLQAHSLYYLTRPPVRTVLEIGFNTGNSAECFLQHPHTRVISLDIGCHPYITTAKQYIDDRYPGRHTLLLGDSTRTFPTYLQDHPNATADVIWIDGGHDEPIARQDLEHALVLAQRAPNTLLIMDDVVYHSDWQATYTIGPTAAWRAAIDRGEIIELGHVDYCLGRGMSWGKAQAQEPLKDLREPLTPVANDTILGADE